MDLIDRQAAISAIVGMTTMGIEELVIDVDEEEYDWIKGLSDSLVKIINLPSAEPEIIRCRECKYAHLTYGGDCKYCDKWLDDDDFQLTLYLDGDFYCGYAERRTDDLQ